MSILPKLFFIVVIVMLAVPAVLAEQNAGGVIIGNGNNQKIINIDETNIRHADIKSSESIVINNEAPADVVPDVNMLPIDNVDETVMIYPLEVLTYPTDGKMEFTISSGSPIAVYTITEHVRDLNLLESSESALTYDPVYHRFEHGIVVPTAVFPHFTPRMTWNYKTEPGYIVLDNRYFPDYSMVHIKTIVPEDPEHPEGFIQTYQAYQDIITGSSQDKFIPTITQP